MRQKTARAKTSSKRNALHAAFPSTDPTFYSNCQNPSVSTNNGVGHEEPGQSVPINVVPLGVGTHRPTTASNATDVHSENSVGGEQNPAEACLPDVVPCPKPSRGKYMVFGSEYVKSTSSESDMYVYIRSNYEFASTSSRAAAGCSVVLRCKHKNTGCKWALKVGVVEAVDPTSYNTFEVCVLLESSVGHTGHRDGPFIADASTPLLQYGLPTQLKKFLAATMSVNPAFTPSDLTRLLLVKFSHTMNMGSEGQAQAKVRTWFNHYKVLEKKRGSYDVISCLSVWFFVFIRVFFISNIFCCI